MGQLDLFHGLPVPLMFLILSCLNVLSDQLSSLFSFMKFRLSGLGFLNCFFLVYILLFHIAEQLFYKNPTTFSTCPDAQWYVFCYLILTYNDRGRCVLL